MSDPNLPPYYNDLDATREHALRLLSRGVKDRRSAMHTFTVATIGPDGAPRIRTVVNRGFDVATRTLRFHTDARSPKLEELVAEPRAAVHAYDARAKIQLRIDTLATIHRQSELRTLAWQATRDFSRACYRVEQAPGNVIADSSAVSFAPDDNPEEGSDNFSVVTLHVRSLEWLYLAHQGHRRARFSWDETGTLHQAWLVP